MAAFVEFPRRDLESSVSARFAQQVRCFADRTAIQTRSHVISYEALDVMANRVANALLACPGQVGDPVAVLLENDISGIATFLGCLKAGRIWVPLDVRQPRRRLTVILEDTRPRLVVANTRNLLLAREIAAGSPTFLDLNALGPDALPTAPEVTVRPDHPAWILHTSGSTGRPKGVVQTQRNALQIATVYANELRITPADRFTLLFSLGVNAAVHDILSALLNGAALHPYLVSEAGVAGLADWLSEHRITIYTAVPTVFRAFVATLTDDRTFPGVRVVKLVGEPVYDRDVTAYRRHFHAGSILINRYGTTETATVRWGFIDHDTPQEGTLVPIGHDAPDHQVLLLDEARRPVAPGEVGEIAVRSRYLSPGYWRNPEQDRVAFVEDPVQDHGRVYLTGDVGRLLPDGRLLHMGRKDFQIKIRGHRIEAAEVEMALLTCPGVEEAVVAAWKNADGEAQLVAYLVAAVHPPPARAT